MNNAQTIRSLYHLSFLAFSAESYDEFCCEFTAFSNLLEERKDEILSWDYIEMREEEEEL